MSAPSVTSAIQLGRGFTARSCRRGQVWYAFRRSSSSSSSSSSSIVHNSTILLLH